MTMTKADVQRGVTVSIAALLTAFFGFASVTSAQVASITNTGPGSNNQIKSNNSVDCSVYNKNNLNVNNSNNQTATTGNANVGSWGAYNPAVWAAQGYSYAQWHAAVQAHMSSYQSNWGSHGGGNTNAGSATTGDASNHNSTSVVFTVNNGGAGDFCDFGLPGGGSGSIHTTGPGSNNQIKSSSSVDAHLVNKNNLGVNNASNQGAHSGDANVSGNTNAGGAGSGKAKNANGTSVHGSVTNGGFGGGAGALSGGGAGGGGAAGGGCSGSISTTGPSSNNQIKCNTSVNTSVTNRNNLSLNNSNYQTATSGYANVSGNTNAGSATTGSASNTNTTSATFSVNN